MRQLYYNGNLLTMQDARPQAEAVLLEDGKIIAIGDTQSLMAQRGNAQLIDLDGATVVPGFIDAHSHFCASYVFPRFDPSPVGRTDSVQDLVEQAKAYLAENPVKEGEWFVGMGYDHALFKGRLHPTKEDLDQISTEVPIVMINTSGWMGVVNSKLIADLGITKDTPNPRGGAIEHDPETGELTGLFDDIAFRELIMKRMPMPGAETMIRAIVRAEKAYASKGYTTVMDGDFEANMRPLMQLCSGMELMKVDLITYSRVASANRQLIEGISSPEAAYRSHIKIAGAKVIVDGSPQIRTAWLTEPYFKVPAGHAEDYCGHHVFANGDRLQNIIKDCMQNRWQLLMQCNGDAAIDQCLDAYERALEETGITEDLRPVLVHAQTVREDQLDRMQNLGIMPSFFHDHVYYWGDWYVNTVLGPERANRISPLASALKRDMYFTMHQDCPVGPPNAMLMVSTAVNRCTRTGQPLGQEYAIDVMDALKAITIHAAYQCFDENIKGSLEIGKYGDMVVLDRNPLTTPKEELRDIQVMATIKEGKIIYQAEEMECAECITD